jgi:outer membrane protein TolC
VVPCKYKQHLGFIIALVTGLGAAQAQTVQPSQDMQRQSLTANAPVSEPAIDLKTAVKRAIDNNYSIKVAREKIEQDRYDTSTTRALLYPNLNLIGKAGEYKDAVQTSTNPPFGGDPYNKYSADLQLSQPLFAFGSIAAIRVQDYNRRMNELDLEIAERSLTQQVIQAFYTVMLNQRLLDIRERLLKVLNETLATANHRLHTGRGQLLDVLQVKTQIALLQPQIEDAHNQLESAGAQLATYLAEQGKYELQVKGGLKGLKLKDVQKRLNFKDARLPELERVHLQREQLDEQRQVVQGKHLPSLFLNGDYMYSSYTQGGLFSSYGNSWDVYLTLTIPLFSGFQSVYERGSLAAQGRQIENQGRDLENTLAFNQVKSMKDLQSTGASLESAEQAADLADQSMNEAKRNYRLATIDFLQFLQVEQSALQADSSLDQIKYNNINSFSNYFIATGQPLGVLVDILQEKKQ